MSRKSDGSAVGSLDRTASKSRIVPITSSRDGEHKDAAGLKSLQTKKQQHGWAADPESVDAGQGHSADEQQHGGGLLATEGCVDCMAAYSFTCSSIENFCRCVCRHGTHVPRVVYLVLVAVVLVGFLVLLFAGVACQARAGPLRGMPSAW